MTDNFEDIEHQETVQAEEGATGARSNLAEAWRTKPIFKLLIVMVVAGALIAVGTTLFGGGNKQQEQMSHLVNPPDVHQAPGGAASPYFIQQTKEAETARSKEALEKGTSALPTPIGQQGDINVADKSDPMNELRGETDRLKQQLADMQKAQALAAQQKAQQQAQQQAQMQAQQQAAHPVQPEQFDTALSQVMQGQMKQLMDSWVPHGIKQVEFSKNEDKGGSGTGAGGNGQQVSDSAAVQSQNAGPPLVNAGTVSYAQLLTEANSDVPAPILAQIVSGPLAGARAVGSFQIANGYNDYLVLRFTLADRKGKDYQIDAIALDPDTTFAGLATEVDQRYFTRVILPAAAAFIQGFGQALGQTDFTISQGQDSTVVTQASPGLKQGLAQGLAQGANTAAGFFQNQANQTKPLVRVAAGTPIGFFFVKSVYGPTDQNQANGANGCPQGQVPTYSFGGRTMTVAYPGATPSGCGDPNALGVAGFSPYNALGGANAAAATAASTANNVPYPNYGLNTVNRGGYGSPYGGVGGIGGLGGGYGNTYGTGYGHY